jgi:hypothetical protein
MLHDHPAEEDLVMLYYRETSPDELAIRAHLETCLVCAAAYRNLARILDACDDLPVPEPHPAFESRMWNRLAPRLHPVPMWRNRWFAIAAAAVMLVAAFLAGRFTRPQGSPPRIVAISADGRQRVLVMALGDHLERSQMVLSELANGPDQLADVSTERERARTLISENRLYRQTAADSGDPAMAQVLDELERVLLDISHGTDTGEIKSRIDSESLLFKLRVLEANLSHAGSSPQPPSAAHTKDKL